MDQLSFCEESIVSLPFKMETDVDFAEASPEFVWRQSILVKAIIPLDSLQYFQVSTTQPVSTLKHHLQTTSEEYDQ
jgi:hypothetical protein